MTVAAAQEAVARALHLAGYGRRVAARMAAEEVARTRRLVRAGAKRR